MAFLGFNCGDTLRDGVYPNSHSKVLDMLEECFLRQSLCHQISHIIRCVDIDELDFLLVRKLTLIKK